MRGGEVYIDDGGDGIDAKGSILQTGGVLVVDGPTVNMEGAVDYDRSFQASGGLLLAVGSAGMAQTAGSASTQPALLLGTRSTLAAGTVIRLQAADGTPIVTYAPTKRFQTIAISSPEMEKGKSYEVYVGGTSTGERDESGLYEGGSYGGGTRAATFTISAMAMSVTF